jgi:WD40-like Beta Propeller Repeat
MYSHGNQKLVGGVNAQGGVPRRQLLQGAGALALAAIVRSTPVFAEPDYESERLGPFGPWSTPVNLGPEINQSRKTDLNTHPGISKNGLSLYISSSRPGGVNGGNLGNKLEIWVSQRASLKAPWGAPVNLDAFNTVPVINSVGSNTHSPNFSADGHLLFFSSPRPGGFGGADLYVSRRKNKHDDFGWQTPVNLGAVINGPQDDEASTYFEDEETGIIVLYLASTRPGGPIGSPQGSEHIYMSTLGDDDSFGSAVLVPELSSQSNDTRTAIRRDGLEFFLASTRPNGRIGLNDIWVATRDTTPEPWSTPVNLGPTVNYPGYVTGAPALSWDGTTLYCYSTRPGGFGMRDLYVSTRERIEREGFDDGDELRRRR